jgi:hypothetical protein
MEAAMRRKFMITTALATAIALVGTGVIAQNRNGDSPAPAPASEQELREMNELGQMGEQLKSDAENALADLTAKERTLDGIVQDVKSARQFVDDVVKLLRGVADRLGPESGYMKVLQEQEALVREQAAEALASANPADHPYGERLTEQANTIAALRSEAGQLAGKLSAEIDRLTRSMPQVGYARTVWKTDAFIATARAYLDTVGQVLRRTSETAAKAESIARPTIPSQ